MSKREEMQNKLKENFDRKEYEKKILESLRKATQSNKSKFPKKDKFEGR